MEKIFVLITILYSCLCFFGLVAYSIHEKLPYPFSKTSFDDYNTNKTRMEVIFDLVFLWPYTLMICILWPFYKTYVWISKFETSQRIKKWLNTTIED